MRDAARKPIIIDSDPVRQTKSTDDEKHKRGAYSMEGQE